MISVLQNWNTSPSIVLQTLTHKLLYYRDRHNIIAIDQMGGSSEYRKLDRKLSLSNRHQALPSEKPGSSSKRLNLSIDMLPGFPTGRTESLSSLSGILSSPRRQTLCPLSRPSSSQSSLGDDDRSQCSLDSIQSTRSLRLDSPRTPERLNSIEKISDQKLNSETETTGRNSLLGPLRANTNKCWLEEFDAENEIDKNWNQEQTPETGIGGNNFQPEQRSFLSEEQPELTQPTYAAKIHSGKGTHSLFLVQYYID